MRHNAILESEDGMTNSSRMARRSQAGLEIRRADIRVWAEKVLAQGGHGEFIAMDELDGDPWPSDVVHQAIECGGEVQRMADERGSNLSVWVTIPVVQWCDDVYEPPVEVPSWDEILDSSWAWQKHNREVPCVVLGTPSMLPDTGLVYHSVRQIEHDRVPDGFALEYVVRQEEPFDYRLVRFTSKFVLRREPAFVGEFRQLLLSKPQERETPSPQFAALERTVIQQLPDDAAQYLDFYAGLDCIYVGLPRDGHAYAEITVGESELEVDFGHVFYHRRVRNDDGVAREVTAVVTAVLSGDLQERLWWSGRKLRTGVVLSQSSGFRRRLRRKYRRPQRITLWFVLKGKRKVRRRLLPALPLAGVGIGQR